MSDIRGLPKAGLISFGWSFRYFYFARMRLANAMRVQIGWLSIMFRMPWLEFSARALHPERFEDQSHD